MEVALLGNAVKWRCGTALLSIILHLSSRTTWMRSFFVPLTRCRQIILWWWISWHWKYHFKGSKLVACFHFMWLWTRLRSSSMKHEINMFFYLDPLIQSLQREDYWNFSTNENKMTKCLTELKNRNSDQTGFIHCIEVIYVFGVLWLVVRIQFAILFWVTVELGKAHEVFQLVSCHGGLSSIMQEKMNMLDW